MQATVINGGVAVVDGIRRISMVIAIGVGAFVLVPREAVASPPQEAAVFTLAPLGAGDTLTHATRGVVKSIDASTMTVSRAKKRGDITFKLSPALYREGTIVVGATVAVRYREEGGVHLATAVAVQNSKSRD